MEVALQTEPHLLAGTVNPTVGKRNVTLPIDNGLNLVEWRQRKEQARGQVTVFGRRLRVSRAVQPLISVQGPGVGVYLENQVPFLKLSPVSSSTKRRNQRLWASLSVLTCVDMAGFAVVTELSSQLILFHD